MTVRQRLTALGISPDIFARDFFINPDELAGVLDSEDFFCISDCLKILEKASELMVNMFVSDVIQSEDYKNYKTSFFVVFDENIHLWKYFPQYRGIPCCVHRRNVDRASSILKSYYTYVSVISFSHQSYLNWLTQKKEQRDDWLTLMEWASEQRGSAHRKST